MEGTFDTAIAGGQLGTVHAAARHALEQALEGRPLSDAQACTLINLPDRDTPALLGVAGHIRTRHKGCIVTYSPKVFLPITNLCVDRCAYCTFRKDPDDPEAWTMLPEEVRACCRAARRLGCVEALMCLGDKPERTSRSYRDTLAVLGHRSTVSYVAASCTAALEEGLLPHTNAGLLDAEEMARLKPLNVSLGLMLESVSPALRARGGAHQHAPDKDPVRRLRMIEEAGVLQIPFTTGILLGIGEGLADRVASLRAIAAVHREHGHIQEIIIQNFRAKPTTRMAAAPEPSSLDTARTIAVARLMLPEMNLQAPPNLSPYDHQLFLAAGINDWGGISPLTIDYVNPEAPWPHVRALADTCAERGFQLTPRLPVYPEYLDRPGFLDPRLRRHVAAHGVGGAHHVG